jgi:NAD-dependent dihydropyrimidine dehydrogenase PreA subunit
MSQLAYIQGVTTLALDAARCNGCRICLTVCPHPVFRPIHGGGGPGVEIADRDACIECGACVLNCPEKALRVDPGVGCAIAILRGWLTRSKPSCGC